VLSENRMSLDADGAERPALSFFVTLSPDLAIEAEEIAPTVIRVAKNLSYEDVDEALAAGSTGAFADAAILDEVARKLAAERVARGALDLQTPEVKLLV